MLEKILLNGEIPVNCFLISHNNKCYIIDPGYEKEKVVAYVTSLGYEVIGILLTHAHIDHIGAIDSYKVPVYLHENEYEILVDNHLNGFEFYGREKPYQIEDIEIKTFASDKVFMIDDLKIEVIFTPGHTVGCVCYKVGDDIYTGDTLFSGSVGRWDFPTGNLDTLKKSVINLVDSNEDEIRIHAAHGPSSTIGIERKFNQFYTSWKKEESEA